MPKKLYNESKNELLKEFKQNHTVKFRHGMREITGAVIGFTKDGVVIRRNGQQDHKEYKADEIHFLNDLKVQ